MPTHPRHATGRTGEELARGHLERLGYTILARNLRTPAGEIDLIAARDGVVAFVEVKTLRVRSGARAPAQGASEALERLRPRQRLRLRRLAAAWLRETRTPLGAYAELRFDAIGVVLDASGEMLALDHLEAAW